MQDVGRMLEALKAGIMILWAYLAVKALIAKRKPKLDEWSEL